MSLPLEIVPVTEQIEAIRGFTCKRKITLYTDKTKTTRLNLTGVTVTLVFSGGPTLASGTGLTIIAAEGEITAVLTPEQTEQAPNEQMHFYVKLEASSTEKVCPLKGTWIFRSP